MNKLAPPLLTFILLLSACTPQSLGAPALLPSQTPQPVRTESLGDGAPTAEPAKASLQLAVYPPGARTGLAEVDQVIDRVLAHDYPALKDLTVYREVGCAAGEDLDGKPPCREGEAGGTAILTVPILGPQGTHQRLEEYLNWMGPDVLGLLAAYRTTAASQPDPAYPAGEYGLVFLLSDGVKTVTLQVTGGKILRYDFSAGGDPSAAISALASEVLLPLTLKPVPTTVPWREFTDPNQRFSLMTPPTWEITVERPGESWILGEHIRIELVTYDQSWIRCFDQGLGDCPFVESDQTLLINGVEARRVGGYIGSVGGSIPQEFLTYLFPLEDKVLVLTAHALPFNSQASDTGQIWPLQGPALELFQRTVETVQLLH